MERAGWDVMILLGALLVSAVFLGRLIFIGLGWLKGPILRQMQSYSSTYTRYYPLPAILFWFGLFVFSLGCALMILAESRFPAFLLGCAIWGCTLLAVQDAAWFMEHDQFLLPHWYRELDDRTSRDEQRRIAYAWLRLPAAVRGAFNRSDAAFSTWADLILLSMTNATADTFVYAPQYRLIKARRSS